MTEEVNGQQPAPQGEIATTNQEPVITETKSEVIPEVKSEEKPKEEGKWYIDTITGLRTNIREKSQQIDALKAENEALKAGQKPDQITLTDAEIDRRATEKSNQNRFNEECNKIAEKGKEAFPTFDAALANLRAVGALGENSNPLFLQAVAELPNAHKLLHHLGNNPDEAARINSLPPLKMAIEMAKIEARMEAPQPKAISKAPVPITPVTGIGGSGGDLSSPDISMEEFSRIRAKQREERYKRS